MARPAERSERMVLEARKLLVEAQSAGELRAAQSVLFVSEYGLSVAQTAEMLGCSVPTVSRLRRWMKRSVRTPRSLHENWGGRRRQNLTLEEEVVVLEPFLEEARRGGVLTVGPIWRAYETRLGRAVPDSTIYRLLWRHGWRKIAPDTRHPKGDALARARWKKNSPPSSGSGGPRLPDAPSG